MTYEDGLALLRGVTEKISNPAELVVFGTPFIHLKSAADAIKGKKNIHIAAQNCHTEEKGAYTGEISASMVVSTGADFVILGHSERRQYFKETNEQLAAKVDIALKHQLAPIFCCGEPLAIREKEKHVQYVSKQLKESLFHLSIDDFKKLAIAYEPIWAIGTGRTATTAQAQEMHEAIRKLLARKYGKRVANAIPILYGGSCNAQNAKELFSQPDVDGGLIGGASLKVDDFCTIISAMGNQ